MQQTPEQHDALHACGATCGAARVLVAEDDPAMRALLAQHLRAAGYEVALAEDGMHLATQLDWSTSHAARSKFDAIVSDLQMPGANGMRIFERLRSHAPWIPVLLITAFGTHELHAEAERLGATLLDKPFAIEKLLSELRRLLENARRNAAPSAPTFVRNFSSEGTTIVQPAPRHRAGAPEPESPSARVAWPQRTRRPTRC